MKTLKRMIVLGLSLLTCFSAASCSSCNKKKTAEENNEATTEFIRNGYSRYSILLADDAGANEEYAAKELQHFMELATGYELNIVKESQAEEKGKYLSIGHTDMLAESGIEVNNDELGRSGYRIVSQGDDVYLFGADNGEDAGTVYSVYKFLNDTVGYVYYSDYTIYYEDKTEVYIKDYDLTDIPTFDTRFINTMKGGSNNEYMLRMRMTPRNNISATLNGHTHFQVIPPDEYYADHPDWFNGKKNQLCLSNEEMTKEFAKNLIEFIKAEPTRSVFQLALQDNFDGCDCSSCVAAIEKYGSYGGVNNVFMNRVSEICDEWLAANQPNRKVSYATYAYYATEDPPVQKDKKGNYIKDENGNYIPVCKEVITRDNVVMRMAFIQMNRNKPLDHVISANYYETLKAWGAVSNNMQFYTYSANYADNGYMYALNDFDITEHNLRLCRDNNVTDAYFVFGYKVTDMACLYDLKAYCTTQLMWNVDLSYEELAMDFIEKSYAAAAPYMKEFYNVYRSWMSYYEDTEQLNLSTGECFSSKVFPKTLVDKLHSLIEQAYVAIEVYKDSDPELYEGVKNKINKEEIMPLYMYLQLYGDSFTSLERSEMISDLESYCNRFNVYYYGENKKMDSRLSVWKASL